MADSISKELEIRRVEESTNIPKYMPSLANIERFDKFVKNQGVNPKSNRGKALKELWTRSGSPRIKDYSVGGWFPRPFNLWQQFVQGVFRHVGAYAGKYETSDDFPSKPDVIQASSLGILENELMHALQFQTAYEEEGEEGRQKLDKIFDEQYWGDYRSTSNTRSLDRYGTRGMPAQNVGSLIDFLGWSLENTLQGIGPGTDYGVDLREKVADLYPYSAWYRPVDESGYTSDKMKKYEEGVTDPSEYSREFEAHRVMLPRERKKLRAREKSLRLEDKERKNGNIVDKIINLFKEGE